MNCSNEYLTDMQLAPESRIPWERKRGRIHEMFRKADERRRSSVSSESATCISQKKEKGKSRTTGIDDELGVEEPDGGSWLCQGLLALTFVVVLGYYSRDYFDLYVGVENLGIVVGSILCSATICTLLAICWRFLRDLSTAIEDEINEAQATEETPGDGKDDFVTEDPLRRGLKDNDPRAFNMMYQEQNHIYNDFRNEDGTWMEDAEDEKPSYDATNFGSTTGRFGSKNAFEPSLSMPGMYRADW